MIKKKYADEETQLKIKERTTLVKRFAAIDLKYKTKQEVKIKAILGNIKKIESDQIKINESYIKAKGIAEKVELTFKYVEKSCNELKKKFLTQKDLMKKLMKKLHRHPHNKHRKASYVKSKKRQAFFESKFLTCKNRLTKLRKSRKTINKTYSEAEENKKKNNFSTLQTKKKKKKIRTIGIYVKSLLGRLIHSKPRAIVAKKTHIKKGGIKHHKKKTPQ